MIRVTGQCVQNGIAIGKIKICKKAEPQILAEKISDPDEQLAAYHRAKEEAIRELNEMSENAKGRISKEDAMIFSVHRMILEEADFENAVRDEILQRAHNASYAIYRAGEDLAAFFAGMKDNLYMNERAADFKDVANRVIRKLQHIDDEIHLPDEPVILLTDDLTPQEVIGLDTSGVLAFVTAKGSVNSHTSILARSLGIISLVDTQVPLLDEYDGKEGIVDAINGRFWIDPDPEFLSRMQEKQQSFRNRQKALEQMIGVSTITKSGRKIGLFANIANVEDAKRAQKADAEGIGLFRSEFLFLNRQDYPSEEEQLEAYKETLKIMQDKPVIIRTLDIGADKQNRFFHTEKEENPAMGCRGIRYCMAYPDVFRTQLRAIYRASAFGNAGILFPMISSPEEIEWIRSQMEIVKNDLEQDHLLIGDPRIGIMIETPAAALISDTLAEQVDFFSIGTNDLTQYTLAMDRLNTSLSISQNLHHQAILRLIETIVKNAHKKKIPVAICGELAADSTLTEYFIKIGVDELSVPATRILSLREQIRSLA